MAMRCAPPCMACCWSSCTGRWPLGERQCVRCSHPYSITAMQGCLDHSAQAVTVDRGISIRSCVFAAHGQNRLKLWCLVCHGWMTVYNKFGVHQSVPATHYGPLPVTNTVDGVRCNGPRNTVQGQPCSHGCIGLSFRDIISGLSEHQMGQGNRLQHSLTPPPACVVRSASESIELQSAVGAEYIEARCRRQCHPVGVGNNDPPGLYITCHGWPLVLS